MAYSIVLFSKESCFLQLSTFILIWIELWMFRISNSRAEFLNLSERNNNLNMILVLMYNRERFLSSLSLFFLSFFPPPPAPKQSCPCFWGHNSSHPSREADTLKCVTIVISVHGLLWTLSSLGKYLTSQLQLFSSHQAAKATHNCLQLVIIGEDLKNDSRELHFS